VAEVSEAPTPRPPAEDPDAAAVVPGPDADPAAPADAEPAGRGSAQPGRAEAQLVLDEAARLATAAGEWARRAVPELAALLRGDRPEVVGKLTEAGTAVAAAARAVVGSLVHPPADRAEPTAAPEPEHATGERRVQRIEID
jgi:hypothetical protein